MNKPRRENDVELFSTHAVLWTNDSTYERKTAFIIDLEDVDKARQYKWTEFGDGFAYCYEYKIFLHRLIMNASSHQKIMFKDRNKKNCRKENLVIKSLTKRR